MPAFLLPDDVRDRHVYVLGTTRSGKSTLLVNLIRQDIAQGKGVGFIDPHGDAAESVLRFIPEARVADTVYFEPTTYPIGLQTLSAEDETEVELLADDLLVTFRRLSQSWGERMDSIFRYAFHTLLNVPGTTFLDLYSLLTDEGFRRRIVAQLTDPILVNYWTNEYHHLPKDAAAPITTRMTKFVLSKTLSRIFGTTDTLNLNDLMDRRGILVVNLGRLGEDAAAILGSILVSQLQIAALRRARFPPERRVPFYLYVDEFQNFSGLSFHRILSEAGKFGLCLTLAHQGLYQLDEKTKQAILANAGAVILFALGAEDADFFEHHLRYRPPRERHWVGASGERTMRIAAEGCSPRNLRPFEIVVTTHARARAARTFPLPTPHQDLSGEIKARMKARLPRPAARPEVYLEDDFEVAPSPKPTK